MGLEFLRATTEERIMMFIILGGFLILAGILAIYDKRKNIK